MTDKILPGRRWTFMSHEDGTADRGVIQLALLQEIAESLQKIHSLLLTVRKGLGRKKP